MECFRYTLRISDDGRESSYGELANLAEGLITRAKGYGNILPVKIYKEAIEAILSELLEEARGELELSEAAVELLFQKLLLFLYRERPDVMVRDEGGNYDLIRNIKRKLEVNFGERITLLSLAQEYHVSPSYLSHIFKRETGYAPIDYLMASRISAAKRLLSSTEKSVKEIVFLCGFGDESNFSRMFKKRTGASPSEFRRKYNSKSREKT